MKFAADLHIHSKHARATSGRMDVPRLSQWAKNKGIKVLGTGDFTHPQWVEELERELEPAETGLFRRKRGEEGTRFLLSSEISCIYSKKGEVRKIHLLVLAPSFKGVREINNYLSAVGNLEADGRPTLGMDAKKMTEIVFKACPDCFVIPAHCLLPTTFIHSSKGIKKIKELSVGDAVFTHLGRVREIKKIYKRDYEGKIIHIKPSYFPLGLKSTPEHPFYGIKSVKYCPTMGCKAICRPTCASKKRSQCPHKYFKDYQPGWIQARNIEKGDILIFPRFNKTTQDLKEVELSDYLEEDEYDLKENFITPSSGTRANPIPNRVQANKKFWRLIGYYLSEGYTNSRDCVSFCFNEEEREYISEVKDLMEEIFNLSYCREVIKQDKGGAELIFFSKPLTKIFGRLLYNHATIRRAHSKRLPNWVLSLPLEKQVEILKGWWRGDSGCTSSRELMNQMKIICLRLGIIPCISKQCKENFNKTHSYKWKIEGRTIQAQHDSFSFHNLSFFQDPFGLLETPTFKKFKTKLERRHGWIDKEFIYIPVRDIETKDYQGKVYNLEVEGDDSYVSEFAAVHNCWTPWFSLFGSRSGFDSMEACFEDLCSKIHAIETGLSSDPAMNWRLKELDRVGLVSNSDAHSPEKIGREANILNTELSYPGIVEAIKSGDREKFLFTVEFFPQEGKYHFDGHRKCGVTLSPKETKNRGGVCPVCGKEVTVGVLHRVEDLASREKGEKPEHAVPYKNLIPLAEIIAEAKGVGVKTKTVKKIYRRLINSFSNEFKVLLSASRKKLEKVAGPKIAAGVIRVRKGDVRIQPGYDGVYGEIKIFGEEEKEKDFSGQKTLF